MIIERDFNQEINILNKVNEHIRGDTNREKGKLDVHVSDLLWCMRQSFYKKIYNPELTPEEVLRFFKGKVSEYAVGRFIFTEDHYLLQEKIKEFGMVAHPDIISDEEDIVIELKQTDKWGFVDPRNILYNSFISYVTQLLYYMVLAKKKKGSLIVNHSNYNNLSKKLDLNDEDQNPFRVWSIELEGDGDINMIYSDMMFKKEILDTALQKKDVGYLPKLVTINQKDTAKCNACYFKERCGIEKDYWEISKIDRVLASRPNALQKVAVFEYQDENVQKTNVNYLYDTLTKKFNELGHHYN